jgi:hypothetical protein
MTLWNPEYRIKVNGYTVTDATLAGLTASSGRTDIYSQPQAGYANLSLLVTDLSYVPYEINAPLTIEVKDSTDAYTFLFGGFVTDIAIEVATAGSTATSQRVNIVAVGALARLARAIYSGNLASDYDGDQIFEVLQDLLVNNWDEVPAALTWNDYNASTTWANAENTGLGEIDQPGDYELDSQNNVNQSVYSLVSGLATSGLGYIYEDAQGRICYADSTHRTQYLTANGYVDLDANQALGSGLVVSRRAGDVRNSITINYGSAGNQSISDSDAQSMAEYGELANIINTTLKNQTDAEDQAAFYLGIRAWPQYALKSITFELQSPEIDDTDRDALLNVFMGMPVNIANLPANMTNGQFQGFVEGWTWTAGYNRLRVTVNVSPLAFSIQTAKWEDVIITETWNTLSSSLEWLDATIVA